MSYDISTNINAESKLSREHIEPSFLIIGAQKAGTTALWTYLSYHPDLIAPNTKEIDFFSCNSRYSRGIQFYLSHFPTIDANIINKMTFEASPDYLYSCSLAAPRIYDYDSRIKLIVLLRDPIKRAFSAWQMYRRYYQHNKSVWFYDWVARCNSNIDSNAYVSRSKEFGQSFVDDCLEELKVIETGRTIEMSVLEHGIYCNQLQQYFNYFSKRQIFIETSENFKIRSKETLEKIAKFIEIGNYCWIEKELAPVFVGQYKEVLPNKAVEILGTFYKKYNQKLYALLEQEFNWL